MRSKYITEDSFDKVSLIKDLPSLDLKFIFDASRGYAAIYLNDENIEDEIRTLEVSQYVSRVAAVSEVREKLVSQQQQMGLEKGVVMDGRDIGTVVFPNAELKIFMTATAEERAGRRFKEMKQLGQDVNYDEVLQNVMNRDHLDTTREDSPLVKAEDAIEIDNSSLNIDEQFQKILKLATDVISKHN